MSDIPFPPPPLPDFAAHVRRPTEVLIIAVTTWVGSVIAVPLTVVFSLLALAVVSMFEDPSGPRLGSSDGWLVAFDALVAVLVIAADVAAFYLLRGRRWAWRVLVVVSVVTTLTGLVITMTLLPAALVVIASLALVVMLFSPNVRAWVRTTG